MSNDYICPFCNHVMPLGYSTFQKQSCAFNIQDPLTGMNPDSDYALTCRLYRCPHCKKISSFVDYSGGQLPEKTIPIYPQSTAIQFPDYIPEQIRSDYEEACAISSLSPKAAATLARRCLQGMIRDFWGIEGKANLYQEIDAIKSEVFPTTWKAIDALRQLGNIGAHMESDINLIIDIDPGEADRILRLIEYLMKEWYVQRHEADQLFNDIAEINEEKQSQKNHD